jgi:hypothetical protein
VKDLNEFLDTFAEAYALMDGHHLIEEFDGYLWLSEPQVLGGQDRYLDAPLTIPEIASFSKAWQPFIMPRMVNSPMQPISGSIVQPEELYGRGDKC